jgi:replicative DNA helicase
MSMQRYGEGQRLGSMEGAERALIASLLADRDAMPDVSDLVTHRSFTDPVYAEIFQAMEGLWERRIPNDVVSVEAELASRGSSITFLDLSRILSSTFAEIIPAHVTYYARRVANAERFRHVQEAYQKALGMIAENPDLDPAETVQATISNLLLEASSSGFLVPTSEAIPDLLRILEAERDGRSRRRVTPTGLGAVDQLMGGGVAAGELLLLAARPSMGKTAFAVQAGIHAAGTIGQYVIFSIEMDRESLLRASGADQSRPPYRG